MQEIYEALVGLCPTFTLPGLWHSKTCDPAFFCLPKDNAAVLAELRQQFADADLIKSGIAKTDETYSLIWQPDLVVEGAPIWAIRLKPGEKPVGLIAQMRTIGKTTWPLVWAFEDHRQNERIAAAGNQVVVAYSMADLAILQSLGIAAVPGGNWDRFDNGKLSYLYKKLRITSQTPQTNKYGDEGSDSAGIETTSLILANWSLATFDLSDIAAATTSWAHLVNLHQFLKLDLSTFGLWKPSDKNPLQRDYELQYLTAKKLQETILDGIEEDSLTIEALNFVKTPAVETITDATRAWQQAERNTMNPAGSQKAYERLCELLERQRYEPLVEQALESTDPLERNALLTLAETSRLMQPQILLLTEKIHRSIGEKGTRAGSCLSKEELASVLALSGRMIDLTKGVRACRQHKPTKKALDLKSSEARSKPSVSTPKNSPR